jgi:hypothetical protein
MKDGAVSLMCFIFLQDTWPWLLYPLNCCAGAESLTKMELLHSRVFYFCRTCGPGFCALSNAAQAQRFQQRWRIHTHVFPTSAGHVALASVRTQSLRRRRESNKDGAFALTCFLLGRTRGPGFCTLSNDAQA